MSCSKNRVSAGPSLFYVLRRLSAQTVVKFATLAPEGTAWMKTMRQFNDELAANTQGRVKFKIYAGGVSGDEKDAARKIRLGQLQAAGFTGVGLGEIAPQTRILDTPFLFKNTAEIDHIYKMLDADFRRIFESKNYILLGWTEVGNVYMFANTPLTGPADLQKVKMWIWEGDLSPRPLFRHADKAHPFHHRRHDVLRPA